jgi:hypothetical protein
MSNHAVVDGDDRDVLDGQAREDERLLPARG